MKEEYKSQYLVELLQDCLFVHLMVLRLAMYRHCLELAAHMALDFVAFTQYPFAFDGAGNI
jgi:hypothetical protein